TISGTTPVWRDSEHLFFALGRFEGMLREWVKSGSLQDSVRAKLAEWFETGLQDWDISRDAPYFGFEIPGHPGKYFYVWFDAPIGYLGSLKALCDRRGLDIDAFLKPDSDIELHHFIGKDISYFHTLFWPAVLDGSGYRKPTAVHVHGFLTIDGQKMSKSRGTFVTARRYLERLPPEALRYYFAAKLGPGVDDIDLALGDFTARVNSDLVGKLVNIASRCAGFVAKGGGKLALALPDPALYAEFTAAAPRIVELYESLDYAQAMREVMALADRANQYVDAHKPWALAKNPARAAEALGVATQGINLFRVLMVYLAPVLPDTACKVAGFLGAPLSSWDEIATPLLDRPLAAYEPLALRLDPKVVAELIESPTAPVAPAATAVAPAAAAPKKSAPAPAAPPGVISIDDFAKLDLRVAKVVDASDVDGSDKLLKLTLDLGSERRTVFSGIRKTYTAASLVGRQVVVVANLAPRKMRFGVSEGMVLCASDAEDRVYLLSPDEGAASGLPIS
ncbi:MAG: methionine--tRNA ligase subunit beta, partial [Gammaproteobacteria bacterium]